jgi:hypothetical protein
MEEKDGKPKLWSLFSQIYNLEERKNTGLSVIIKLQIRNSGNML